MFLTGCGVTEYGSGGHYPTLSILCPESPILIILYNQRYASKLYPKPFTSDHIISFYKLTYSTKYRGIPKYLKLPRLDPCHIVSKKSLPVYAFVNLHRPKILYTLAAHQPVSES